MKDLIITPKNSVSLNSENSISGKYYMIWEKIPNHIKSLLIYMNEYPPENLGKIGISISYSLNEGIKMEKLGVIHDPSTIYFPLPLFIPNDTEKVIPPPRHPKYYQLLPEQRYIYLNWLSDISQPIDEGYRNLFLFGLELQLLTVNFDEAWKTILQITLTAKEPEDHFFLINSIKTLFTACIMNSRIDLLSQMRFIFNDPCWNDMQLLLKYYLKEPIESNETINIFTRLTYEKVNRRYIYQNPNIFSEEMAKLLLEKTGHSFIIPDDYMSEDNKRKPYCTLGYKNEILPFEFRNYNTLLPNPDGIIDFLYKIYPECHEYTKERLRNKRKRK